MISAESVLHTPEKANRHLPCIFWQVKAWIHEGGFRALYCLNIYGGGLLAFAGAPTDVKAVLIGVRPLAHAWAFLERILNIIIEVLYVYIVF